MVDPRPSSDPTELTTQALYREISHLREYFDSRIENIEKAAALLHEDMVRVPTQLDRAIGGLRELHEAKFGGLFESIESRLAERDARFSHAEEAATEQTELALSTQKEAAEKAERSMTKSLDQTAQIFNAHVAALDGGLDDLKDRVTRMEGRGSGMQSSWLVLGQVIGWVLAIVAIVLSVTR